MQFYETEKNMKNGRKKNSPKITKNTKKIHFES